VFLIRDPKTQPVRFELQAPVENELIQHLSRVQRQDAGRNLPIARNATQLGLHIGAGDSPVAYLSDDIFPGKFVAALLRHEVQQHSEPQNPDYDSEKNPHTYFLFT
jgi:hypothetical protein